MVSGRAIILLVTIVLLLIAMAIIAGAALLQKPTRTWRLQWQQNTADLKRAGIKTLKGEPVQPRVVPFDELMSDPVVTYYQSRPDLYQTQPPTGAVPVLPSRVSILPKPTETVDEPSTSDGGWDTGQPDYFDSETFIEAPEEPILSFDEKRELGLIGSWNPGPAEVSEVPEIEPGMFWATVWTWLVESWTQVQTRYRDWNVARDERKAAAEVAETTEPVADSSLEADSPAGVTSMVEIDSQLPPPPPPVIDIDLDGETNVEIELPQVEIEDIAESPNDSSPRIFDEFDENEEPTVSVPEDFAGDQLAEWIGGLQYLLEPRPENEWREYVPQIDAFRVHADNEVDASDENRL